MSDSRSSPEPSLDDLVHPLSGREFLSRLGHDFQILPGADERFAGLLRIEDVERILCTHRFDGSRLRVVRDGDTCPPGAYADERPAESGRDTYRQISPKRIYALLDEGATVIVDAIDEIHPPLLRLARALERSFREHVQINAYLSSGSVPGFDVHWDDHDALIVQLDGVKRWQVHGQTRRYPMFRDATRDNPLPTTAPTEFDLTPGDVLYLPRGWWHAVRTARPLSLHLTIGITHRTGVDLLGWLADESRRDESMRRDLPRHLGSEQHRTVARIRATVDAWLSDPRILERFFADLDRDAPIRPSLNVRAALPGPDRVGPEPGASVAWLPSRSLLERDELGVHLYAAGLHWTFDDRSHPVLASLHEGVPLRVDDVLKIGTERSGLSEQDIRSLLAELTLEGLIEIL